MFVTTENKDIEKAKTEILTTLYGECNVYDKYVVVLINDIAVKKSTRGTLLKNSVLLFSDMTNDLNYVICQELDGSAYYEIDKEVFLNNVKPDNTLQNSYTKVAKLSHDYWKQHKQEVVQKHKKADNVTAILFILTAISICGSAIIVLIISKLDFANSFFYSILPFISFVFIISFEIALHCSHIVADRFCSDYHPKEEEIKQYLHEISKGNIPVICSEELSS